MSTPSPGKQAPTARQPGGKEGIEARRMATPQILPDPDEPIEVAGDYLHHLASELPIALDAPPQPDAGDGGSEAAAGAVVPLQAATRSGSASGLKPAQRRKARAMVAQAALLGIARAPEIDYSQHPVERWEGITKRLRAWRGEVPKRADCSSFATWVLWQGLGHYRLPDNVNGTDWKSGWTGTLVRHGKRVVHRAHLRVGDLVFYGNPSDPPKGHVAIYIGGGEVASHGSKGGPYRLDMDYRTDIHSFRRYI
jgi:cell wall-associated NlpC family hydrolase